MARELERLTCFGWMANKAANSLPANQCLYGMSPEVDVY